MQYMKEDMRFNIRVKHKAPGNVTYRAFRCDLGIVFRASWKR